VPEGLDSILVSLVKAQTGLLTAADAVPADEWKSRPSEGKWSAAELVAHLIMVERAVIGQADRVAQKPPKRVSLLRRIHIPMALVESRWIRRKSPVPVEPAMLRDKEEMLAELGTRGSGRWRFWKKRKAETCVNTAGSKTDA
jgi:hypothetical protein